MRPTLAIIIAAWLIVFSATTVKAAPEQPALVAHAGGGIRGWRYTNSLEALEESYGRGFTFFEVDLELTREGEVVLLHDWDYVMTKFFGVRPGVRTVAELKKLTMRNGLTPLTFNGFAAWLRERPETYAIIDTKRQTLTILKTIARQYPELRPRIIPQVYYASQYAPVARAGFPNIIFSLYATNLSNQAVLNLVTKYPVWAVAMPADRAAKSPLPAALQQQGIFVYAHLVDSPERQAGLEARGVQGFYTAFLDPA